MASEGCLGCLSGQESTCNGGATGDKGSILGSGRSSGGENGNPLQYSCLKNPMERGMVCYRPWGCKESDITQV